MPTPKEKMYREYMDGYRKYKENQDNVKELEAAVIEIGKKKIADEKKIKSEHEEKVRRINDEQKRYQQQLDRLEKNSDYSSEIKEFGREKQEKIEELQKKITFLEKEQSDKLKKLQKEKQQALTALEREKEQYKARLYELEHGDLPKVPKKTDENQLRQKLEREKERQLVETAQSYDASIREMENSLRNMDLQYQEVLVRELSCIQNDERSCTMRTYLSAKAETGTLPQALLDVLEEPVETVVQRNRITGGSSAVKIADGAFMLDDLRRFVPGRYYQSIELGIAGIFSIGLFLFFVVSGVRFGFVETALNAIVNFLIRALCAGAVFGIIYGILGAAKGKAAGVIGGVVGAAAGFVIAMNWKIELASSVTGTVEWILKLLLCAAVFLAVCMVTSTKAVGRAIEDWGLKIGFVKEAALECQEREIRKKADSFYVLLRYQEVITCAVQNEKHRRKASINARLESARREKAASASALAARLDQEAERTLKTAAMNDRSDRERYKDQQAKLIEEQDQCMRGIYQCDARIPEIAAVYEKKKDQTEQEYIKKIENMRKSVREMEEELVSGRAREKERLSSDRNMQIKRLQESISDCKRRISSAKEECADRCKKQSAEYEKKKKEQEEKIRKLEDGFRKESSSLHQMFEKIRDADTCPKMEEAKGVLSDYFYLYKVKDGEQWNPGADSSDDGSLEPVRFSEIKHDKNPVIFLYESKDSSKIAKKLHPFMLAVSEGLHAINYRKIFDLYIMDPVSKGIDFAVYEKKGFLKRIDDIRKLNEIVGASMERVARDGDVSIDERNRRLVSEGNDEDDISRFGRYQIVQFIVPEEDATQNTDFFNNDIWTRFESSRKYGFLPIFYIKKEEWEDALDDEEKFNSKFIMKLDRALGREQENIYIINCDDITVRKYRK